MIWLVVYISFLTVTAQSSDPVIVTFAIDVPYSLASGFGGVIISTVLGQIPTLFGVEDEYVQDVSPYNADGLLGVVIELDPSTPNLDTAILAARLFVGSGESFDIGFMTIAAVENSFQVIFKTIPSTEAIVYSSKGTTEWDGIETTTPVYIETTIRAVTETVQQSSTTAGETITQDNSKASGTEVATQAYNMSMGSKIILKDVSTSIIVHSTERTTLSDAFETTTSDKKETNKAAYIEATTPAVITSMEAKIAVEGFASYLMQTVPVYSTDWIEVTFAVDMQYLYVGIFGSDMFVTAIRNEIPELFGGIEDRHIQDIRLYDVDGNTGATIEVDPSTPNIKTILSQVKAFVDGAGTVPTEYMDVTAIPGSYKDNFPDTPSTEANFYSSKVTTESDEIETTTYAYIETTSKAVTETVQETSAATRGTSTEDNTKASDTEFATQAYMSMESKIMTKVIFTKMSTVESLSQTVTLNVATTMHQNITDASTSAAGNIGLPPTALMSMTLVTALALNK